MCTIGKQMELITTLYLRSEGPTPLGIPLINVGFPIEAFTCRCSMYLCLPKVVMMSSYTDVPTRLLTTFHEYYRR